MPLHSIQFKDVGQEEGQGGDDVVVLLVTSYLSQFIVFKPEVFSHSVGHCFFQPYSYSLFQSQV